MLKKESDIWNLPSGHKYRFWSQKLLRQRIGIDQEIDKYLIEDELYCVNPATIALYQFQKQPLLGKYKSVIFDCNQGIVLSCRSTQAHLTSFAQNCLLAGLEFQREFARKINLVGHNVIATGRLAYFSLRSYNTGNIDWIALHNMASFESLRNNVTAFESVTTNRFSYIFTYDNCSRHISRKVSDSLFFNHALYLLGTLHLKSNLGWRVKRSVGDSLIDQSSYFHPHQSLEELSLKKVMSELLDKKHARYGNYLADYYELPLISDAHKSAYSNSKRPDTLF